MACSGDAGISHWSAERRSVDFFDAKGLVERVGQALEIEMTFDASSVPSYLTPGRAATVTADNRVVGAVGMLSPAIVAAAGVGGPLRRTVQREGGSDEEIYVAELDLDGLTALASPVPLNVKPLPRYPSISRDISIVVDDILPAAAVRGTIRSVAPDTLVSIREFDRYRGKGVPERRVSLSLRLAFRSPERTLTDAEVDAAMKQILNALKNAHDAVQR